MKKAVIVGAGSVDLSTVDIDQYTFIAGCDGGTRHLSEASICPHIFLGDFDSLENAVSMEMFMLGVPKRTFNEDKDFTDMKGAMDFITQFDYGQIDIYGATGTRLDHSVGNMMLLFELFEKGVKGRIIDSNNIITAIEGPAETVLEDIPEGWYVSFVPVGKCEGVTVKGLKYKAEGLDLDISNVTQAISNENSEDDEQPSVSIKSGKLLIFYSRD